MTMSDHDDHNPQLEEFLFYQEDKLGRLEAETQNRESNLVKRERAFIGRRLALSDHYEWLVEQEQKLIEAAQQTLTPDELIEEFRRSLPVDLRVERTDYKTLEVCQRSRKLLIEIRRKCIDEREAVLLRRNQEIERAEEDLSRYESLLKQRELLIQRFRDFADSQGVAAASSNSAANRSGQTQEYRGISENETSAPSGVEPAATPHDEGHAQKREHDRVGLELVVSSVSEHNFFTGFSKNISLGGIFVSTHEPRPVGTEIAMRFYLPGGTMIETLGEVQWVQELHPSEGSSGMGIRFVNLGDAEKAAIERFIAYYREPIFYDL